MRMTNSWVIPRQSQITLLNLTPSNFDDIWYVGNV
jgi:hypothetical protein